jgi:hypothetical protein
MGDKKRQRSIEWQNAKLELLTNLAFSEAMNRLKAKTDKPAPMVEEPDGTIHQDGDAHEDKSND